MPDKDKATLSQLAVILWGRCFKGWARPRQCRAHTWGFAQLSSERVCRKHRPDGIRVMLPADPCMSEPGKAKRPLLSLACASQIVNQLKRHVLSHLQLRLTG